MKLLVGNVVKNILPSELVRITKYECIDENAWHIEYIGLSSQKQNDTILDAIQIEELEVINQNFNAFDFGGNGEHIKLFVEAQRVHSAYQFDPLFAVNCSIIDPLPHQVEAVYKYLLPLPRIRFLLADDTGAGKTIMAGLLLKEMLMRGSISRILIITPGGLTKQWQEDEMAIKFNLDFTLVNRARFQSEPNVFQQSNRIITSIDFIGRSDVLNVAAEAQWDFVIFDECHKLSAYDYGNRTIVSQRYEAAQVIANKTEHLLLLTATPHRGREDTFLKLLQLLDADVFASKEIANERIQNSNNDEGGQYFFLRRLKEQMLDWNGKPLYTDRETRTVNYVLSKEEKKLYDAVTDYLYKRKEEASATKNTHVSLALTVMQRRLTSSISAINKTLHKRLASLTAVLKASRQMDKDNFWQQKIQSNNNIVDDLVQYEELDDEERDNYQELETDPKNFKFFTTAKSPNEINQELEELQKLCNLSQNLYNSQDPERKYVELIELLKSNNINDHNAKLVIFTEHRDTLEYLADRLSNKNGFKVTTIHGGKNVEQRRQAQREFAQPDTQILIATDAAGEGINLQFCRYLINWDIPWNPNRLEQRMGRIHRYGQTQKVLVFNLVAQNTREGKVLERLLSKIETIRQALGKDRVYDVIQDILEDVQLSDVIDSVFNGKPNRFDDLLAYDDTTLQQKAVAKLSKDEDELPAHIVDYKTAYSLQEDSRQRALQPYFVSRFFLKAFDAIGGKIEALADYPQIYSISQLPPALLPALAASQFNADYFLRKYWCFDKTIFLKHQQEPLAINMPLLYLNPGTVLYDSLVRTVTNLFPGDAMRGATLIAPEIKQPFYAYFIKTSIGNKLNHIKPELNIAYQKLSLLCQKETAEDYFVDSDAQVMTWYVPEAQQNQVYTPNAKDKSDLKKVAYNLISKPIFEETKLKTNADAEKQRQHIAETFIQHITYQQLKLMELQTKQIAKRDKTNEEKIAKLTTQIESLRQKEQQRLEELKARTTLSGGMPDIMTCIYVVPLTQAEYSAHYGMSRDDEAADIAMKVAMTAEVEADRQPQDVSLQNLGYDIVSNDYEGRKRYIEVKGRSGADGSIMLSDNEMGRLQQLGDDAWLYIVTNCKSTPSLRMVCNPAKNLKFEMRTKGVQYFYRGQ
jgi:superfamily II DNA or RNA helicase